MKINLFLGKETALRPSENNKSSEPSTPVSTEDKPIVPDENVNTFHEPDVIASTKCPNNGNISIETDKPMAPPRRPPRRQRNKPTNASIENDGAKIENNLNVKIVLLNTINQKVIFDYFIIFQLQLNVVKDETNCLTSPASTIESITRELEHSLDLHSATKGQYIVNHHVSNMFLVRYHYLFNIAQYAHAATLSLMYCIALRFLVVK